MHPPEHECEQARRRGDSSYDGHFVVAAAGVGHCCRPSCAVQTVVDSAEVFPGIAAALAAGYRPCPQCRPERAPRAPEWRQRSLANPDAASAALNHGDWRRVVRALGDVVPPRTDVSGIGLRVGLPAAAIAAVCRTEFGVSPVAQLRWQRVALAKRLVDDSDLSGAALARASGYASASGCARALRQAFGCGIAELRAARPKRPPGVTLVLPVRAPFAPAWVCEFLAKRSLPGLEEVAGTTYRRRLTGSSDDRETWLRIDAHSDCLHIRVPAHAMATLPALLLRIERVFDVHADPVTVTEHLQDDPWLQPGIERHPGVRVPGAWDGFETAVRAILGQQVSVARARNLAIDLIARFGSDGDFPTPEQLVTADVSAVGMPGKRGAAVRALAAAVLEGSLQLDEYAAPGALFDGLCALPGIGPWTAGYVCMRTARDPDAFPQADWVVLKQLELKARPAQQRAEVWRPWRAYALMYIWQRAADAREQKATS